MSGTFPLDCALAAELQQVQSQTFDPALLPVVCVSQKGPTTLPVA